MWCVLMIRRPPSSIRTGTPFPFTTACRSFTGLPERACSISQRLFGAQLIVYVVREAVPLDDASALISQRLGAAVHPAIHAVRTTQAILHGEAFAGDRKSVV